MSFSMYEHVILPNIDEKTGCDLISLEKCTFSWIALSPQMRIPWCLYRMVSIMGSGTVFILKSSNRTLQSQICW